jgi:hypothetical protein
MQNFYEMVARELA